jgi:hypothetical protein
MKVETTETEIRLIPESQYEIDVLKRMRNTGIEKTRFENDWDSKGYLRLVLNTHPWDRGNGR